MRIAAFKRGAQDGLAVAAADAEFHGLLRGDAGFPGMLDELIQSGEDALKAAAQLLARGPVVDLDQVTLLPPLASSPHKDPRAPQNLVPIGGLERELRRRLGDQQLLYRSLRAAVGG